MSWGGGGGGENEEWRKKADTHKMSPEQVRAAGVEASKRPPRGHHPGEVLHQRGRLPLSYPTMAALAGLVIASAVGYAAFYSKKNVKSSHHADDNRETAATNVVVTPPEDTNIALSEDVTRRRK